MVMSTPRAMPTPSPPMFMAKRPSTEMTTVVPAKRTARPEVSTARTTAPSGSSPSWRPCRYRVTMNSA